MASGPQREQLEGLYVVTDSRADGSHEAMARAALAGGASIVQLRVKDETTRRYLEIAHRIRAVTREYNATFIVNDRVDIALACDADGVHLGPDDMSVVEARRLMPEKIIGASCGTISEAQAAYKDGADYIGAGAVFGTYTKLDAGEAIGLNALEEIVKATPLPVAAIGGVTADNIRDVVQSGALMACVVSAISAAGNAGAMTEATRQLVQKADFSLSGARSGEQTSQ